MAYDIKTHKFWGWRKVVNIPYKIEWGNDFGNYIILTPRDFKYSKPDNEWTVQYDDRRRCLDMDISKHFASRAAAMKFIRKKWAHTQEEKEMFTL